MPKDANLRTEAPERMRVMRPLVVGDESATGELAPGLRYLGKDEWGRYIFRVDPGSRTRYEIHIYGKLLDLFRQPEEMTVYVNPDPKETTNPIHVIMKRTQGRKLGSRFRQ